MSAGSIAVPSKPDESERLPRSNATEGLTRKAFLNAVAYLLNYGAQVAVGLLVIPVLVSGLGTTLFGVWQMLRQMVSYMSAADGRPTQALKWVIASEQALDKPEAKRRYVGSAMGVWLLFLPVLLLIGTSLIWLSPRMTKVGPELHSAVRLACALLVGKFLLSGLVTVPDAVLAGMNLGYKRMGVQAGLEVLGAGLAAGAVWIGLGLVGVAAAEIVQWSLTGAFFWIVVRKYVSWFGVARPSVGEVGSFLRLSSWYLAWTLVNRLLLASDVIMLGILASPSSVTMYAVTAYAAHMAADIMSMTAGAAMPGLGGLIGQKRYGRAMMLHDEMMAVTWLAVTAIGSTILLWNQSFLYLWVGPEHYADSWANLLMVLVMSQLMFIRADAYVIDLTLQMRGKVIAGAVAVVLSIVFAAMLIPPLGIVGLCLGIVGGRLALSVSYPLIVRSHLGQSRQFFKMSIARPIFIMSLLFGVSTYIGRSVIIDSWPIWMVSVGASLAVIVPIALFAGLSSDSRAQVLRRCKMIWIDVAPGAVGAGRGSDPSDPG